MEGFDEISVTCPRIQPSNEAEPPEQVLAETLKETMAGLGFNEVINYSFVSPNTADLLKAGEESPLRSFVPVINPLTVDQSVMRTSLVSGILETVRTNVAYGMKDLRLFELGKVFIHTKADSLPDEKTFLSAVMTGLLDQKQWYCEERSVDFFDIKGIVEALLKALGIPNALFKKDDMPPYYNPEISSGIYLSDRLIGTVGQVLPAVMTGLDLEAQTAYIFELDIRALLEWVPETLVFESLPRFPAVFRDISLIVQRQVESVKIQAIVIREGGELLESVHLYDLYEGEKIDRGEKALTLRICYRSKEGTLEGREINRLHEAIIEGIRNETGARLREG
jgi:phenylalanyl-tRNA synthetase beta chain